MRRGGRGQAPPLPWVATAILAFVAALALLATQAAAQDLGEIGDANPTFELTPEVSFFTGDALRATVLFGAGATYRLSRAWWLMAEGLVGRAQLDPGERLEVDDEDAFVLVSGGLAWNIPLRLGLDDGAWYADLYTSAGPAWVRVGGEDAIGGFIGGGMTVHTPLDWLGLRADLKNLFYGLENHGGQDLNADLEISLGPVLQL